MTLYPPRKIRVTFVLPSFAGGGAERVVAEYYEDLHGRPWVVAGVWVFGGVNIFVLWWKRRELAREEE